MSKPTAVLISDIHYNINTLKLADDALNKAVDKANMLGIPLVIAGDLHDTKANMRAECINAMLKTLNRCEIPPFILVGNHDRINEKDTPHSLNFLEGIAIIVDQPMDMPLTGAHGIPYYHDVDELRAYLKTISDGGILIMHQGLESSNSGEYIQDKSALKHEDVSRFRVISGHYHTRQHIKTGRPQKRAVGMFSYIGNPYTLNFAEANDPQKGFQILNDDGSLDFVPTNLRKHVKREMLFSELNSHAGVDYNKEDLLWITIHGSREQIDTLDKIKVTKLLQIDMDYRLDFLTTDEQVVSIDVKELTQGELLDQLIDSLPSTSDERKARLKELWRNSTCG